jgi:hypothetical protein
MVRARDFAVRGRQPLGAVPLQQRCRVLAWEKCVLHTIYIAGAAVFLLEVFSSATRAGEFDNGFGAPMAHIPRPFVRRFVLAPCRSGFYEGHWHVANAVSRFFYPSTPRVTRAGIGGTTAAHHTSSTGNALAGILQGLKHQLDHGARGVGGDAARRGPDHGNSTISPRVAAGQDGRQGNGWPITLHQRLGSSRSRPFLCATGVRGRPSHAAPLHDPRNALAPLITHESATRKGWNVAAGAALTFAELTLKGANLFVALANAPMATPAAGGWEPAAPRVSNAHEYVQHAGPTV